MQSFYPPKWFKICFSHWFVHVIGAIQAGKFWHDVSSSFFLKKITKNRHFTGVSRLFLPRTVSYDALTLNFHLNFIFNIPVIKYHVDMSQCLMVIQDGWRSSAWHCLFISTGICILRSFHSWAETEKTAYKPTLWPPQSWRIRRARCLASSGKAGLCMSSGKQQSATTCVPEHKNRSVGRKGRKSDKMHFPDTPPPSVLSILEIWVVIPMYPSA